MCPPELLYWECDLESLGPFGFGIVVVGDRVVLIQGPLATTLVDHTLWSTTRRRKNGVMPEERKAKMEETRLL